MELRFEQEVRGEVERIQQQFKDRLSADQILKITAGAINGVLQRSSIPRINKKVKEEYNITQKYLSRTAQLKPKATAYKLWGGISLNDSPIPMIAFKPKWRRKKRNPSALTVEIRKGRTEVVRHAFIATMASGHKGVFARGKYSKKKFEHGNEKTQSGKTRITQIHSPSPFKMATIRTVADDVREHMGIEVLKRVEGALQGAVDRIGK